jgi:hypothetical protein
MTEVTRIVACVGCCLLFSGCARGPSAVSVATPQASSAATDGCDPDRDQRAILAMAASYDVEFDFEETEALTPGYHKHPGHKSYATELVTVVESTPGHVSLQHILQLGDGPKAGIVKHWRQDWAFEDRELLEFRGHDVWERRQLSEGEARCAWTQAVYSVDDAPRYDGFGRWRHDASGSVWTSNETWRPLPRREYTTRSDYDVLVAVNRHRITRDGWDHEQDNRKLVLEPQHFLARERGTNRYTRAKASDTEAAAAYWQATSAFWKDVRAEWQRIFAQAPRLSLRSEATGARLHEVLFARAEARQPMDAATSAMIRETLEKYLTEPSSAQP